MTHPESNQTLPNQIQRTETAVPTRIISICGMLITASILTLELTALLHSNTDKIISDWCVLALFFLQFIFPGQYIFVFLASLITAFFNIWGGGNLLGLLFYLFGLSIAMKMGFLRTHNRLKISALSLVFFGILFVQLYKRDFKWFVITVVNIAIGLALIGCALYLFNDNLKEFYSKKKILDIKEYDLTERQISCLRGCAEQKKLKTIADEECISESAIKREMLVLYETFKVEDRHDLYRLLSEFTIIF